MYKTPVQPVDVGDEVVLWTNFDLSKSQSVLAKVVKVARIKMTVEYIEPSSGNLREATYRMDDMKLDCSGDNQYSIFNRYERIKDMELRLKFQAAEKYLRDQGWNWGWSYQMNRRPDKWEVIAVSDFVRNRIATMEALAQGKKELDK